MPIEYIEIQCQTFTGAVSLNNIEQVLFTDTNKGKTHILSNKTKSTKCSIHSQGFKIKDLSGNTLQLWTGAVDPLEHIFTIEKSASREIWDKLVDHGWEKLENNCLVINDTSSISIHDISISGYGGPAIFSSCNTFSSTTSLVVRDSNGKQYDVLEVIKKLEAKGLI